MKHLKKYVNLQETKIADKIVKLAKNSKDFEKITIPPGKIK